VALASGAALGGLVGAILAVPVAAVVVNVVGEYREAVAPADDADEASDQAQPA
jgi:predicted PurR-regulated permease PerM